MRVALVVGSARGVWEDLRAASALFVERPVTLAVNAMVAFLPRVIDHAVSHHGQALVHLLGYRRCVVGLSPEAREGPVVTHSTQAAAGVDRVWPEFKAGDSSLLAARIALALGCARVILAGVPLDASGRIHDDPAAGAPFDYGHLYRPVWEATRAELAGRVVSMSGFTRELLGAPA